MAANSIKWPSVSVIIPVHGDHGQLVRTTRALALQDYQGIVEVIIVDNGGNEDLKAAIWDASRTTIVGEETPGSYSARNAGIRAATGEIFAFTDGDCLPRPDWIRQGVTCLIDAGAPAFVGGRIELFAKSASCVTNAELWDRAHGLRQDQYVSEGWAATANMLTTRGTMEHVGVFESRLMSGGDREWGRRACDADVKACFAANAVVDHPARRTMRELHTKIRRVNQGGVDAQAIRVTKPAPTHWRSMFTPHTRSILNESRKVSTRRKSDRVRYFLVAHWIQYYFGVNKVYAMVRSRRTYSL